MDVNEFLELLENHDWTYSYSDDHSAWRRGVISESKITSVLEDHPEYAPLYQNAYKFAFSEITKKEFDLAKYSYLIVINTKQKGEHHVQ